MSNSYPEFHSISQASKHPKLFNKTASVHSIRRWIVQGVGDPKIKLKATRIGKFYYVTEEDVREFIETINSPAPFKIQLKKKSARVAKAKKRLQEAGA